jgi:hypothetical protein
VKTLAPIPHSPNHRAAALPLVPARAATAPAPPPFMERSSKATIPVFPVHHPSAPCTPLPPHMCLERGIWVITPHRRHAAGRPRSAGGAQHRAAPRCRARRCRWEQHFPSLKSLSCHLGASRSATKDASRQRIDLPFYTSSSSGSTGSSCHLSLAPCCSDVEKYMQANCLIICLCG